MLRRIAKGKQANYRLYLKRAKQFIEENPCCQIKSRVCTGRTECVHHARGRGIYLAEVKYFKASCTACNGFLETWEGKAWGKLHGFRLDRIGIIND